MRNSDTTAVGNILIVDDDAAITDVLGLMLSNTNYRIYKANSGAEALSLAEKMDFDLILTDIIMPGISGYDMCRKIKENPASRDIPVIFISGKSEQEDAGRSFEQGGLSYVKKPFTAKQIRDLVKLVLESTAS